MMNGILFGLAFAIVAVGVAKLLPAPRKTPFLALLLAAAAAVYVGGAIALDAAPTFQTLGFAAFLYAALAGWQRPIVLAAGWLAHAVWDVGHLAGMQSVLPVWYEVGCVVADPLIAVYLVWLARRTPAGASSPATGETAASGSS